MSMQSVRVCDSTLTERYRSTIYMYWERLLQPFELIREYHEHIIGGPVLNHTSTFHVRTKSLLGGDLWETFCAKKFLNVWGDLSLQVQKYKVQKILHTKLGKHSDETDRLNKRWDMKKKITKRNFQRNIIWKGKTCESAEKWNFSF